MRTLLLILTLPLYCSSQYKPNEKLAFKTRVITDSGTIKGYFVYNSDSSIVLSSEKRYPGNTMINIPVHTIRELQIKNKTSHNLLGMAAGSILGFTLAAGLIQNNTDNNNDGKTSFWELLFAAIEGTTSGDRRRRNTAFIAGAAGGTAFLVAGFFANRKFSLVFPINNRNNFFNEKRIDLNNYTKF